ncbi:hypothetical protein [Bacillus sp. Bos-x628]|uniref:hypothetical protein n=1 Tax=Bacillus maqinnsis TaxID=3229854 RepID=UPI00338E6ED7
MREIKTEAQTLDLSKKVIVEVSLAELIVLSASLLDVGMDEVNSIITTFDPYPQFSDQILGNLPMTYELMNDVDDILVEHGLKGAK